MVKNALWRVKSRHNARCRVRRLWHRRLCMGTAFCLRTQVYDGCCYKHQDTYDPHLAKRLRVTRHHLAQGRRQAAQREREYRVPSQRSRKSWLDVFDFDDLWD